MVTNYKPIILYSHLWYRYTEKFLSILSCENLLKMAIKRIFLNSFKNDHIVFISFKYLKA